MTGARTDWRDEAACREADPELFFPVGTTGSALGQIVRAKAVCAGCGVRGECLAFAMKALSEGVAGGMTADERRQLRPVRASRPVRGVNGAVVGALAGGERVQGATRREVAAAAVALHHDGCAVGRIIALLGVGDREVYRWLERYRCGDPLTRTAVNW